MRWKRLIRCLGGRRCAEVVATDRSQIPPGAIAVIEYTCHACGTHYRWDSATRKRIAIEELAAEKGEGIFLKPGESKFVTVNMEDRR